MVAREHTSGRTVRVFQDELGKLEIPPYAVSPSSLFVAFYASAELGCHLALGWPLPQNVLDLYVEFRNLTNGLDTPAGSSLLGALVFFGLDSMAGLEKDAMRKLALRGGPYRQEEKAALLSYCEHDVLALGKLLNAMLPKIDIAYAQLRGRYMKAVACAERNGVPIDTQGLAALSANWDQIQDKLISRIDSDFNVFEGRTFKADKFAVWLSRNNIPWPRLMSERLALDEDTFREMGHLYPQITPLRQLRTALSQMRLSDLAVGSDGRNRTLLSPFRARTSRNQPSNAAFVFGPAVWLRFLIKPEPATAIAYIDWSQQEFGIAAALSGDVAMKTAYTSGDSYLAFAKQVGAVPQDATKASHGDLREMFKACALAVQYGMEAESLARRIGKPVIEDRQLLRLHRDTYKRFWEWSDAALDFALLRGSLHTVFGWTIHVGSHANPRMLRNFPMQANGAEMLRLASCLATENGVRISAFIHDAVLIEAPLDEIEGVVQQTQEAMATASGIVLGGFELRSEAKIIRYPNRFDDDRGKRMWDTVWQIIGELPEPPSCAFMHSGGCSIKQQDQSECAHPLNLISVY
jgi:hypothetical protein